MTGSVLGISEEPCPQDLVYLRPPTPNLKITSERMMLRFLPSLPHCSGLYLLATPPCPSLVHLIHSHQSNSQTEVQPESNTQWVRRKPRLFKAPTLLPTPTLSYSLVLDVAFGHQRKQLTVIMHEWALGASLSQQAVSKGSQSSTWVLSLNLHLSGPKDKEKGKDSRRGMKRGSRGAWRKVSLPSHRYLVPSNICRERKGHKKLW